MKQIYSKSNSHASLIFEVFVKIDCNWIEIVGNRPAEMQYDHVGLPYNG